MRRSILLVMIGAGLLMTGAPRAATPADLASVMAKVKVTYRKLVSFAANYQRTTRSQTMGPTGPTTRISRASGKMY